MGRISNIGRGAGMGSISTIGRVSYQTMSQYSGFEEQERNKISIAPFEDPERVQIPSNLKKSNADLGEIEEDENEQEIEQENRKLVMTKIT